MSHAARKSHAITTMSAEAVAKAGYDDYRNNEDIVIAVWKNRLMVRSMNFLPLLSINSGELSRRIGGDLNGAWFRHDSWWIVNDRLSRLRPR